MSSQPTQGGNRGARTGGVGPRTRSQQSAHSPPVPIRAPDSLPPPEPVAAPVGGLIVVSTRASSPSPSALLPLPPALERQSQPTRQALGPRESPQQPAAGCIYTAEPPQRPAGQPAASAPSPPAPQQERPRGVVQVEEVDEQRTQESERVKIEETFLRAIIRQRKREFEKEQEARQTERHAKQLAVLEAKKAAERYIEENRRRRAARSESSSPDARRGRRRTSSDSIRSRSPISRRPPSPMTRRPPSPMTRRPPSPLYRRPPSPMTRRSRSPITRSPPGPMTRRPPSPMTRRSRSPMNRRSRSPTTRRRSPSPVARRSLSSQRNEISARRQEVQLRIEQSNLEALLLAWEKQELENELTRIEIARLRSLIERESADPEQGTNADGSGPSTSSAGHRGPPTDCSRRGHRSDDD
ncbi:unnamed protein product [Caenorhabditis brenneri]